MKIARKTDEYIKEKTKHNLLSKFYLVHVYKHSNYFSSAHFVEPTYPRPIYITIYKHFPNMQVQLLQETIQLKQYLYIYI